MSARPAQRGSVLIIHSDRLGYAEIVTLQNLRSVLTFPSFENCPSKGLNLMAKYYLELSIIGRQIGQTAYI